MLVQCKSGPTSVTVFDTVYTFVEDEHGRAVAEVWDPKHLNVLTSVIDHYRAVKKEPEVLALTSIEPTTAELGGADVTMVCTGTGFGPDSVIFFADQAEPIVFMSDTQVSTVVKPSLGWGAVSVPVKVRNYAYEFTDELSFTFTEPVGGVTRAGGEDDDLDIPPVPKRGDPIAVNQITGIGSTVAGKLQKVGITDARQIAKLSKRQADALDEKLELNGRIERDQWVEQAKGLIG